MTAVAAVSMAPMLTPLILISSSRIAVVTKVPNVGPALVVTVVAAETEVPSPDFPDVTASAPEYATTISRPSAAVKFTLRLPSTTAVTPVFR